MLTSNLKNCLKFNKLIVAARFNFATQDKLSVLDGKPSVKNNLTTTESLIQPWVDVESRLTKLRGELVLSSQDKIEKYAFGVIKGYFRTTYKDGLTLESNLADHGLDSLDSIELAMVLEDELGYIIEAETMPKMTKVKHFVNFIKQMEAYKAEYHMLPQEKAVSSEESWNDWIPQGDKLKAKLYGYTNKDQAVKAKTEEKKVEKAKH